MWKRWEAKKNKKEKAEKMTSNLFFLFKEKNSLQIASNQIVKKCRLKKYTQI